jgi:hypothetical protein
MRHEVAPPCLQRAPLTLLLSVLGLTVSCSENVLLGSACPFGEQTCILVEPDAAVSLQPPVTSTRPLDTEVPLASMDAGVDSSAPSAGPSDAGDGSAPASFASVVFYNLSFERRGGVGGDVVLSNTVSVLIPIPPVDTVFAMLPNWYACVPLGVSSLTWMNRADAGSEKSEFGDYLSFVINGTAVRQQLGAPSLHLDVQGATSVCGAGTSIGRSAVLSQSERWTRACVTFTADKPYTYLLLAPSHDGAAPPGSARLYLDELRQVASCAADPSLP